MSKNSMKVPNGMVHGRRRLLDVVLKAELDRGCGSENRWRGKITAHRDFRVKVGLRERRE